MERKYPKTTGYYVYTHIIPDKLCYFGMSSNQPYIRWQPSFYNNTSLEPYIEQYGWDAIEHMVIQDGLTKHQAEVLEDWFITKATKDGFCINKNSSGGKWRDNPKEYRRIREQQPERKEYKHEYQKTEKSKEYRREYKQRPEVKERQREYNQRPEVKERKRKYSQRPEVKERQREYKLQHKKEIKERNHEYYQRPEVKERRREYYNQYRLKKKQENEETDYNTMPKIA